MTQVKERNSGRRSRAEESPQISELGRVLRKIADRHAASGAKLLNRRELERETAERRGRR